MENELGTSWLHFINPKLFNSLNAIRVFLWRGLKRETPEGTFIAAYSLDEIGLNEVGELLWQYLREGGEILHISEKILDAFTTTGPYVKIKPGETTKKEKPKNSKT